MKKIEAIIRPEKLEEIKEKLSDNYSCKGLTILQVLGHGQQKGQKEYMRGQEIITSFLPKIQLNIVVSDEEVEPLIDLIITVCQTGEVGDGKIFIYPVEEAVRIRTSERGIQAV